MRIGQKAPAKKYIWERHFSNHRNVWKVKTSWLDRVQDTQKRETANHTQNWGLRSSRTQKCFEKIDLVLKKMKCYCRRKTECMIVSSAFLEAL